MPLPVGVVAGLVRAVPSTNDGVGFAGKEAARRLPPSLDKISDLKLFRLGASRRVHVPYRGSRRLSLPWDTEPR